MMGRATKMICLAFALAGCMLTLHLPKAHAVSGSSWQADRIIDDSVFFNPNTMSAQDIQTFLNSKVPVCDTNGTQTSELGGGTRAQYGTAHGKPPPYVCLKDYSQNVPAMTADTYCGPISAAPMSAATIIKTVSAACSINPQVLLILLQKEQGLVTDDWPFPIQYTAATGYGCPDTSSCDPNFSGFFNQVYYGARQYQKYVKQPQLFNYAVGQTAFVGYNPNSGCGGTNITMSNRATAGLYNYTPYQPNQAALNNLYGSGDSCSAYGNRNFWRQFSDWFGSPTGAEYAWLIQSFTYSGGDNNLTVNVPETVTLKALNVSRHPWYNNTNGNNPVRLGTWQPPNAASQFASLNGTNNRFADMSESQVDPNQVATFTFTINPHNVGSFVLPMNLVAENAVWMTWPGFSPTINVVSSPYQWRVDDVSYSNGTGVMDPSSSQLITVKATNTGNATWYKGAAGQPPVWLATWPPDRASSVANSAGGKWPSQTRITQANDSAVAPGAQTAFQFNIRMPSSGDYYERLNLVAEGQSWFNDAGLTLYLHGKTYAWQPVWQSLSTGNPNIGRNQTFDVTIKVKNTGEMAWKKTDPFQVKLGTTNPKNRGSGFYTSSWISDTRPSSLVENNVEPGQTGTFTFNARAPGTPGQRYEYFSLVAEGLEWLNDPGLSVYVNVL